MLIEELDAVERDVQGAASGLFVILEVKEVLAQFFFVDAIRGLAIVLCQLSHSAHVGLLGLFGQAAQLHVLDHALS
jgi:hypothetical protein